ncbi:helicase RepA family protein [Burkholderia cenocepacia]|uniref:helicase RepA family protein n=1 Tax=Burkholderia cenocepacia TaxID=95486 RepID=UPI002238B022|nr:helicase RepA family protein [Burkholderia cenocepacia]MCW5144300.1 helicase RepA family protein [Burkholderia cenocepacia]
MKSEFRDWVDGAPVFDIRQYRDESPAGFSRAAESEDFATPTTNIRTVPIDELLAGERQKYLVKGVFPAKGVAAIYGPSASGKTFLTLDVALSVARGASWFGRRVNRAGVVYVAAEGEAGISDRLRAALGDDFQDVAMEIVPSPVDLLRGLVDLNALISAIRDAEARIGRVGLVVIDTLARCMPGGDENTSDSMGAFLQNVDVLRRAIDGLALIVHHTGKDTSAGARGHSSFFGAMDGCLEVARDGDHRSFKVAKSRDGVDGESQAFRLAPVELGIDDDGDPITSCVVEPDDQRPSAGDRGTRKPPSGANAKIAIRVLKNLLKDSREFGKAGAPVGRPCVRLDEAQEAIMAVLPVEPKRKRERTESALTSLLGSGMYEMREDWIWAA